MTTTTKTARATAAALLLALVLFGQAAQPVRIDTAAATARHAVASL